MTNLKIAMRLFDAADNCDSNGFFQEADILTRIAKKISDMSRLAHEYDDDKNGDEEIAVDELTGDSMTREEIERLIHAVEAESSFKDSKYHGNQHWRCVSMVGSRLAKQEGINPLLPLLFGIFHDSMRENDDDDPYHGRRGAGLAVEMYQQGLLPISEAMLSKLVHACNTHTEAPATYDPHAGVCYDADRLNLWRVGIEPHQKYISTDAGLQSCHAQDTNGLHHAPMDWGHVLDDHFDVQPYAFQPGQYGYFEDHYNPYDNNNDWEDDWDNE